jgi:hypothetical protein
MWSSRHEQETAAKKLCRRLFGLLRIPAKQCVALQCWNDRFADLVGLKGERHTLVSFP